jgi:hypothetical protein
MLWFGGVSFLLAGAGVDIVERQPAVASGGSINRTRLSASTFQRSDDVGLRDGGTVRGTRFRPRAQRTLATLSKTSWGDRETILLQSKAGLSAFAVLGFNTKSNWSAVQDPQV